MGGQLSKVSNYLAHPVLLKRGYKNLCCMTSISSYLESDVRCAISESGCKVGRSNHGVCNFFLCEMSKK